MPRERKTTDPNPYAVSNELVMKSIMSLNFASAFPKKWKEKKENAFCSEILDYNSQKIAMQFYGTMQMTTFLSIKILAKKMQQ